MANRTIITIIIIYLLYVCISLFSTFFSLVFFFLFFFFCLQVQVVCVPVSHARGAADATDRDANRWAVLCRERLPAVLASSYLAGLPVSPPGSTNWYWKRTCTPRPRQRYQLGFLRSIMLVTFLWFSLCSSILVSSLCLFLDVVDSFFLASAWYYSSPPCYGVVFLWFSVSECLKWRFFVRFWMLLIRLFWLLPGTSYSSSSTSRCSGGLPCVHFFFLFFFVPIPFIIFALLCIFIAGTLQPILPSSTRVELHLPTLGALSSWSFL